MKTSRFFVLASLLLALSSCNKDEPDGPNYSADNNITFTINGVEKELLYKVPASDPFFNAYLVNDQIVQIQRMVSEQSSEAINLLLENTDLDALSLPHTFRFSNDSTSSSLTFFYYDEDNNAYGQNILDPSSFELLLEKKENDLLEGSFEGVLYHSVTDSVIIENGNFSIWVKRY